MADSTDFFSDLGESSTSGRDSDFFSDLDKSSPFRKAGRTALQLGISGAERALMPYEIAAQGLLSPETQALERRQDIFDEIADLGTKKRKGVITPEEQQYLDRLIEESKDPQKSLQGIPEYKGAVRGAVEGLTGIDTKPEGILEHAADWYATLKDPKKAIKSLKSFKNIKNLPKKDLIKKFMPGSSEVSALAAGVGGEEGGELGKLAGGSSALVLANIVANLKKGKLMPASKEMRELYKIGKDLGLSDKEITPIVQSRFKLRTVGGIAAPSKRAERAIETSESALGKIYDEVKAGPLATKKADPKQLGNFFDNLEEVASQLRKSKYKTTPHESLIKQIDNMVNDVAANGIDPSDIIETWYSINKDINWNSLRNGDKLKNSLKEPLFKLFNEIDPKGAKKFSEANKLWANLKRTANKVSPAEMSNLITKGEVVGGAKGLYDLITTGSINLLSSSLKFRAARLLATEMLINPKLNSILNKTIAGMTKGRKEVTRASLKKLVDFLKEEYPDEDWNPLLED